jgi:hypothetical protein
MTVCVLPLSGFAQDLPRLVGWWSYGPAYTVALSGNHAYLGSGTVLRVVDVSNLASPMVVGEVVLPNVVQGVAASGNHVYVADAEHGLRVIDVSEPEDPVEVGPATAPPSPGAWPSPALTSTW